MGGVFWLGILILGLVAWALMARWGPRLQVVRWYERGLLQERGRLIRVLEPGAYWVWPLLLQEIEKMEARPRILQMKGQEVNTSDPLVVRLNAAGVYEILDVMKWVAAGANPEETLYLQLQMTLRELAAGQTADQLIGERSALSSLLGEKLQSQAAALGARWQTVGVKDVILPGEVRDLLQKEVEARKNAQGRLAAAREEVAIARIQANTARIYEEHPVLVRMEELATLETVAAKPGNTVVLPMGLGSADVTRLMQHKES